MRARVIGIAVMLALAAPSVYADTPNPPTQMRQEPKAPDGEAEYNRGVRARVVKDWVTAIDAFKKVVTARPKFADAWNELGFALRNVGRYPESLDAYDEALRLKPNYPEAIEYLGEAYVKLGRMDDARKMLERLQKLDARRAQDLAAVIEKAK
jgi:superkiller protein 3